MIFLFSLFDTIEERYNKHRKSVQQFTISQIGTNNIRYFNSFSNLKKNELNHQHIVLSSDIVLKNIQYLYIYYFFLGISAFIKENERWELNEFNTVYCLVKWWRICSSLFIEHVYRLVVLGLGMLHTATTCTCFLPPLVLLMSASWFR